MSHFSVLAVVPAEELTEDFAASASSSLLQRMLPYCELTDDPAFLIFEPDPDGPDENESGEPGCFFNPNAQWDWYEIGGRWSGELFVPETVPDYLHAEGALREPERSIETICNGLRQVSGARMRDICWDVLRNQTRAELTKSYALWQKVFAGEADPPCTTHLEKDGLLNLSGALLLARGEPLEAYLTRMGTGKTDRTLPPAAAFLDRDGEWHGREDCCFLAAGTPDGKRNAWRAECLALLDALQPDDALIVVDCHI